MNDTLLLLMSTTVAQMKMEDWAIVYNYNCTCEWVCFFPTLYSLLFPVAPWSENLGALEGEASTLTAIWRVGHHCSHSDPEYHPNQTEDDSNHYHNNEPPFHFI